jgi:uncharacterized protein (DUF1330 family)
MAAFIIADIEVKDSDAYQEYIQKVPALVAKHGGVYRARGGSHTVLEGNWQPRRLVILEFPDRKCAEAFYDDPDYLGLKLIRQKTTDTNLVLLEGL